MPHLMPHGSRTVKVKPVSGEPGVYDVESWTDPDHPHRVHLFADGPLQKDKGLPECDCEDFVTRKRICRRLGADSAYFSDEATCRHIRAVLRYETMVRIVQIANARK